MKKNIKLLIAILFIISIVFRGPGYGFSLPTGSVEAGGDLSVDFGTSVGTPLFTLPDMAPGDTMAKNITVYNDANTARKVGIRGISRTDIGNLSHVFFIIITENGTDLYGGSAGLKTLKQFFIDSARPNGILLSHLAPHTHTVYTIKVSFAESAGNEYQKTQVVFDITVGIVIDLPAQCEGLHFSGTPILGTERNDSLVGTSGNDLIIGLEGNDVIIGNGGDDCIVGSDGVDILNGGSGSDILIGEKGHDIILGGIGNDILLGGNGYDITTGGGGNDTCEGELKASCEL